MPRALCWQPALLQLQREPVAAQRLLVRHHSNGLRCGALGDVQRTCGAAHGQCRGGMVGQGCQRRVRIAGVPRLERLGNASVQRDAARCGQFVVKHFADQHVAELVLRAGRRHLDDAVRQRFVEPAQQLGLAAAAGQIGQQRQVEVAADAGGDREQVAAGRRELVEPPADHRANAARHGFDLRRRGVRVGSAGALQKAQRLHQVQRVALGAAVHGRNDRGRRRHGACRSHHPLGFFQAQALQRQAAELPGVQQLGQRGGQGMLTRHIHFAAGAEQHDAAFGEFLRDEGQEPQRRGIGPVQVVQNQQQRAHGGHLAPEMRDRGKQPKARLVAFADGRHRGAGRQPLGEFGCNLGRRGGIASEQRRQALVAAGPKASLHCARPGQEGRRARFLEAAAPQGQHAAPYGQRCRFLREPGLADAGLAAEHDHAPAPGQCAAERVVQQLQLAAAADEGLGRAGCRGARHWRRPAGRAWRVGMQANAPAAVTSNPVQRGHAAPCAFFPAMGRYGRVCARRAPVELGTYATQQGKPAVGARAGLCFDPENARLPPAALPEVSLCGGVRGGVQGRWPV